MLLTHQLRTLQPLSSTPLESVCDLFCFKISLPLGAAATVTSLYNAWKRQWLRSEQLVDDTARIRQSLPPTTTRPDYNTSTSTTAVVTPNLGVVAPLCATSLFVQNIDEVIGPQTSTSATGLRSSSIFWEQDESSYRLKSEAIVGPTRVDVNMMNRQKLARISDPRQQWRAATSRLRLWCNPMDPIGQQILNRMNELQQLAIQYLRCQSDCHSERTSLIS